MRRSFAKHLTPIAITALRVALAALAFHQLTNRNHVDIGDASDAGNISEAQAPEMAAGNSEAR